MDKKQLPLIGLGILIYALTSIWVFVPLIKAFYILKNYDGKTPLNLAIIVQMYKNPLLAVKAVAEKQVFVAWFALFLLSVAVVWILAVLTRDQQSGITYLKDDGTHGTSNWMTLAEAKKVLGVGTNKGLIFGKKDGKIITLQDKSYFNKNVAIFGAPGSMKSRSYVRTNILQLASEEKSMVMTDPKGELFRDMYLFLKKMGYNVKVFNLTNMQHSDRWNPISEIKDDIDAQLFAEVVIANTKIPGSKGSDPFWDRAEQNLLKALVLYVVNELPEKDRNLASVYSLLASAEPKQIDTLFKKLDYDHPAKMPYNIYMQANETVRTGVVIGLGTRLQVFQNKLVQKVTETSDIDLTLPGKEKCAYFCIFSDTDSTFDFLAGLFFSFLFIKLTRYADYRGGTGEKQVFFLLDEFPNIGAIPDFTKKISTMRSRGLHCSIIFQNIAQLKNRYPNDAWQEIIGNCDSRLFLGGTDIMTAQFVSDLLGEATVRDVSHRKKAGLDGIFDFGDMSVSGKPRKLLKPDEILRLEHKKAILLLRGQKPLLIEKMDYTEHPLSKRIIPMPVSQYIPEWAKEFIDAANGRQDAEESRETTEMANNNTTLQQQYTAGSDNQKQRSKTYSEQTAIPLLAPDNDSSTANKNPQAQQSSPETAQSQQSAPKTDPEINHSQAPDKSDENISATESSSPTNSLTAPATKKRSSSATKKSKKNTSFTDKSFWGGS